MPIIVTNQDIINHIKSTQEYRATLNARIEALNKRREDFLKNEEATAIDKEDEDIAAATKLYNTDIAALKDLMDFEYGYGNWQHLDVKDYSFFTRQELEEDPEWKKTHYILANPDIQTRVVVDDIKTIEEKADEILNVN